MSELTSDQRQLVKRIPLWRRVNTSTALMLVLLIIVGAFFGVASPHFLEPRNLVNLAMQIAPALIVAVAVTFVITAGEIDLSVGSILAFTGVVCATLLSQGVDSALVLPIGLAIGAAWGAINGLVSAYGRVPSFIVTLATMSVIRGIALIMTEGYAISVPKGAFFITIGQGRALGLSWATWIALGIVVIGAVLLHGTRFGQYVTGVGSNQESVRRAGVNTKLVKLLAFVFTGAMSGLAGMITTARLASADANAAADFGLTMVTAVVLGGTNLLGGRGSIIGTVIGSVLVGALSNGLTLLGVNPYVTPILTGAILVVVILINLRGSDLSSYVKRLVTRS